MRGSEVEMRVCPVTELVYMSVEINLKNDYKYVKPSHSIILQIANLRIFKCGHADTFSKCDY